MKLSLKSNAIDFARELHKRQDALPKVGSETVNEAAKYVAKKYEKALDSEFTIRNNYTKKAIKIEYSKPTRSKGGARALSDINAIVGVRKLKGGKDHYLLKQEEGGTKKGTGLTQDKVAFPLNAARGSGLYNQPIGGRFRIFKNLFHQPVFKNGANFGQNDGLRPNQRFAVASRLITETKMFIMETSYGLAVFAKNLGHIEAVRDLKKNSVNIKPRHLFEQSKNKLTPVMFEAIFKKAASKFLKG